MSIKNIIMNRDGVSESEANDIMESAREEMNFAIECGDFSLAEDIMLGDLGLEMDYFDELIFGF